MVHRRGGGEDIGDDDRSLFSERRAGDFSNVFFCQEEDSVVVVELHSMISQPWKKTILDSIE
jgi:hypothetical protein